VEDDIHLMSYKMYSEFNLPIHFNYGQDVMISGHILPYPLSRSRLIAVPHYTCIWEMPSSNPSLQGAL